MAAVIGSRAPSILATGTECAPAAMITLVAGTSAPATTAVTRPPWLTKPVTGSPVRIDPPRLVISAARRAVSWRGSRCPSVDT